jgi:hypothetical protein
VSRKGLWASALLVGLLGGSSPAHARPQANTGLVLGVAGRGEEALWEETVFWGGLHGDLLFGREGNGDLGIGPYLSLHTAAFDDVRPGAGASLLVPIHELVPAIVSAGAFARLGGEAAAGASGRLFLGARSFNYHGAYNLSAGVVIGVDRTFAGPDETVLTVAAQVDGLLFALPFVLAYEALFHHSED